MPCRDAPYRNYCICSPLWPSRRPHTMTGFTQWDRRLDQGRTKSLPCPRCLVKVQRNMISMYSTSSLGIRYVTVRRTVSQHTTPETKQLMTQRSRSPRSHPTMSPTKHPGVLKVGPLSCPRHQSGGRSTELSWRAHFRTITTVRKTNFLGVIFNTKL